MINIVRNNKNWEAEFSNIKYVDALEIAKNENIKEISIYQKLGLSAEDFGFTVESTKFEKKFNVKAYDNNALKNSNIKLLEGRLPKNPSEIIISSCKRNSSIKKLNEKIELTLNGVKKEYIIVGIAESLEFDMMRFFYDEIGAITYLDNNNENSIVDITILTKNIQRIYDTVNSIGNNLNIQNNTKIKNESSKESEEEIMNNLFSGTEITNKNSELKYNTPLLNYSCVLEIDTSFAKQLVIVSGFCILIIITVSIIVIYTAFKMTYSERIKEFGMLSSVGMDKKQRRKMLIKEANLLSVISIPIGIILGLIISKTIINLINILFSKTLNDYYSIIIIDKNVELYMKVPLLTIILVILIVYFIIYTSCLLPIKKINKISEIDAIKNLTNKKHIKIPKIIKKLFNEEGVLAYKNIRREKSRYKSIVISLSISIILFLCVNGIINNIYLNDNISHNKYNDYSILLSNEKHLSDLLNYLQTNNLINDYYLLGPVLSMSNGIDLKPSMLSNEAKDMIENGIYEEISQINTQAYFFSDNAYNDILKKAGITELQNNEIIICDTVSKKTKYGKNLKLTNFKVGDIVEIKGKIPKYFKIAGITSDFAPYITSENIEMPQISILVNNHVAEESKLENYNSNGIYMGMLNLDTDNPYEIDKALNEIDPKEEKYFKNNLHDENVSYESQKNITKILAYSFVLFIALISAINIFNTISFSVLLRKREFAILRSVGMTNKQINKMVFLEGIFYGLDSIIFGILISIGLLYILYIAMINSKLYLFSVPIINILICIIISYIIIFLAIFIAKKKINKQNIIDEVKNENV